MPTASISPDAIDVMLRVHVEAVRRGVLQADEVKALSTIAGAVVANTGSRAWEGPESMVVFTRELLARAERESIFDAGRPPRVEDFLWWCYDRADADFTQLDRDSRSGDSQ